MSRACMTRDWSSDGWFVVPWQVIFRDIDAFGHVNNAVYLTYFEWARTLLWFALTGAAAMPRDIGFIVARAEIDFKRRSAWSRSRSRAHRRDAQHVVRHRLRDPKAVSGNIAATGKVVVVLFDWKAQAKTPISDGLRQKVRACSRRRDRNPTI